MRFYRFGFGDMALKDVRDVLEALGAVLQERSSDFLGGIYFLERGADETSTKVYVNRDISTGDPLRPSLAAHGVLVDVVSAAQRDTVVARFAAVGGSLLDEDDLPDDDDDEDDEDDDQGDEGPPKRRR